MARYQFYPPGISARVAATEGTGGQNVLRFDRYVLSQLTTLFGFFTLVLVAVYWLNRVVLLFNKIVGDGQSMRSFLELSLLSLPDVIRTMLPLAAFISALYVVNRMSSDSELVVVHAVGVSPARLARPVLVFGALVAVLLAVLSNYLVPVSRTALADRMAAISRNITAKVLTEGKFIHPTDGVTLFVRKITPLGEMQDLFLSDGRSTVSRTTYSAQRALLVPVATGPKLVMFDGTAQTLNLKTERLSVTRFKESTYDIGALIGKAGPHGRGVAELSTYELLTADPAAARESGASPEQMRYDGHARIAEPLTAAAAALMGFAVLMLGGFSRFGNMRQMAVGAVMLILLQVIIDWCAGMGPTAPGFWALAYLPPAAGFAAAGAMIWLAGRPRRAPGPSGTGVAA